MPVVYLIDERMKNPRSLLDDVPAEDMGFLISSFKRVPEFIEEVDAAIAAYRPPPKPNSGGNVRPQAPLITELRILAQGDVHELQLGRGVDVTNAVQFAPLSSHLRSSSSQSCSLLGCDITAGSFRRERFLGGLSTQQRIGSPFDGWQYDGSQLRDGAGYPLLHALARTLRVPVTAGVSPQGTPKDCQFSGATVTIDPFGKVSFAGVDLDDPSCRAF